MTPERFQQIEDLYHAARGQSPHQRDALLANVDPDLRREVESLLADPVGAEFLDLPAIHNAPQLLDGPPTSGLDPGTCLGPYRIESKLGQGGMGEVFRAIDTRLGRPVAIKTTPDRFTTRFAREARAIASLNHPNICTLHDVGPNYLVMELVEGETIAQRLKQGPMPLDTVRLYALQIAAALAEAHAANIVHRDLKPANIMIGKSGIKVLDFGLAKTPHDDTVTRSPMILGTPPYMAPEQREGRPSDCRSDIYSLGCVLYEMATGHRITPHRRRIPSPRLERIVSRCLEDDPRRRWQSVAGLQRELAALSSSRWRPLHSIAAAVLLIFLTAAYFFFPRTPPLTDKDTIVLADFLNTTGDPIFDGTLRQGVAIQLEQSPFLKIMDDEHIQRVLRRMSLPPGAPLTHPVAREVCVREGAAATIDGAITSLGNNYVITLQAISCQDGSTLARRQIQAAGKELVLNAVGSAATALRARLGESRNSIQKLSRPLEQVTTPSLQALQFYTAGLSEMNRGDFRAAVPLFQRAISIDPGFAMAHYSLRIAFDNAGDVAQGREYSKLAFRMIDRVSEYERDKIATMYYKSTGETDKAIDAYQSSIRDFPRDWAFHNDFSELYIDLGRYEDGLIEGLEATRLQPDVEPPYRRQLDAYICLDRLADAKQLARKLQQIGLGRARIHQRFLEIAFIEADQAAISTEIQWFAGKREEYLSLGLQAADRNLHGQRRESHKLFQRAAAAARRQLLPDAAAEFEEADARADALAGNCHSARTLARPALALAMCGAVAHAEQLAARTSKIFPNGTIWNLVQLPTIRAVIALARHRPADSVELLASAAPFERAHLDVIYFRGLAYLRLNNGAEAASEFRKIVDHKGANWAAAWRYPYWGQLYSLSYLGLARAFALAGDPAKARTAFQVFFQLWKDADRDIPLLRQAKAEYSNLR